LGRKCRKINFCQKTVILRQNPVEITNDRVLQAEASRIADGERWRKMAGANEIDPPVGLSLS
jgi:hypothetical protein